MAGSAVIITNEISWKQFITMCDLQYLLSLNLDPLNKNFALNILTNELTSIRPFMLVDLHINV